MIADLAFLKGTCQPNNHTWISHANLCWFIEYQSTNFLYAYTFEAPMREEYQQFGEITHGCYEVHRPMSGNMYSERWSEDS